MTQPSLQKKVTPSKEKKETIPTLVKVLMRQSTVMKEMTTAKKKRVLKAMNLPPLQKKVTPSKEKKKMIPTLVKMLMRQLTVMKGTTIAKKK